MPTTISSGTQLAVISNEHELDTDATGGVYVLAVDTAAMALGDVLELRIKSKVLGGGALGLAYQGAFSNAQPEPLKYSIPISIPATIDIVVSLKQTAGTGRSFPWRLMTIP